MDKNIWSILLVEDDEDDYILTRSFLLASKENQFILNWVKTLQEALEQLEGQDAILVDYDLGTSSGLELIQEAALRGCRAPIILLTGHGDYALDLKAMELGAVDYLTKGEVSASLLERTIRYAIGRKRIEEDLLVAQQELENKVYERTRELQQANQQLEAINEELRQEVAERKRVEQKLAYQAYLIENVSDAIIATDENLKMTSWNSAAETIYGWKSEDVLGRPVDDFLNVDSDKGSFSRFLSNVKETGWFQGEVQHNRADGTPIYLEFRIVELKNDDGSIRGYVSVNRDVTQRRLMEAELSEVHRRLMDGREAERIHLSQELHDGPIQALYGITFHLANIRNRPPVHQDQLEEVQDMAHQVVDVLRVICGDLRPPTLAPFGLEQTIRSHADRFHRDHAGIDLHLDLYQDRQIIPENIRLALFRIYQQTMINIARHASATKVFIRLELDAENVLLEVRDNGKGFEVPERWIDLVRDGHLGLAGSAERAEAVGGRMDVISAPDQGTSIVVTVPRETW
jgi:PAS domain S-box-containing protein